MSVLFFLYLREHCCLTLPYCRILCGRPSRTWSRTCPRTPSRTSCRLWSGTPARTAARTCSPIAAGSISTNKVRYSRRGTAVNQMLSYFVQTTIQLQ